MGHTHLNLEVELGYSHLLSNMEIASSREVDAYVINPPSMWMNMDESSEGVVSNDLWWTEEDESLYLLELILKIRKVVGIILIIIGLILALLITILYLVAGPADGQSGLGVVIFAMMAILSFLTGLTILPEEIE